jgi:hypothetical protein
MTHAISASKCSWPEDIEEAKEGTWDIKTLKKRSRVQIIPANPNHLILTARYCTIGHVRSPPTNRLSPEYLGEHP